jgi:hypothetical protein
VSYPRINIQPQLNISWAAKREIVRCLIRATHSARQQSGHFLARHGCKNVNLAACDMNMRNRGSWGHKRIVVVGTTYTKREYEQARWLSCPFCPFCTCGIRYGKRFRVTGFVVFVVSSGGDNVMSGRPRIQRARTDDVSRYCQAGHYLRLKHRLNQSSLWDYQCLEQESYGIVCWSYRAAVLSSF